MSIGPYVPGLRELITDSAVVEEFDRLSAYLAGAIEQTLLEARGLQAPRVGTVAEAGLDTGQTVNTRPPDQGGTTDPGIRWSVGPWLIKPSAVLLAPQISGDQNNYAPISASGAVSQLLFQNAILVELSSDASGRAITGMNAAWSDYIIVFLLNVGSFPITLRHENAGSATNNQFRFAHSRDYPLYPNVVTGFVWRATASGAKRWFPLAADGIGVTPGVSSFMPALIARNWWGGRADGIGTTYVGIGHGTPTLSGSLLANNQAGSTYNSFDTGAVNGAQAGILNILASASVDVRHEPTFTAHIRTGASIAVCRFWVGLTDTSIGSVDSPAGNHIAFRYSTGAGDPGWVGSVRDGVTQNVSGQVAAIAANTNYLLKIRVVGTRTFFSVDGGTEVSLATNVPAGTTALGFQVTITTLEAASKILNISRHFCEFGS